MVGPIKQAAAEEPRQEHAQSATWMGIRAPTGVSLRGSPECTKCKSCSGQVGSNARTTAPKGWMAASGTTMMRPLTHRPFELLTIPGAEGNTYLVQDAVNGANWAIKLIKLPLPTRFVQAIFRCDPHAMRACSMRGGHRIHACMTSQPSCNAGPPRT